MLNNYNKNIYPVQIFKRGQRTPGGGGDIPTGDIVNGGGMWTTIQSRLEMMVNDIYLTDINGYSTRDAITIKPLSINYIDTGSSRDNRSPYCTFKYVIPPIPSEGIAYKSFNTNYFDIRPTVGWFWVGSRYPLITAEVDWFKRSPSTTSMGARIWKKEEENYGVTYYNYDVTEDEIEKRETDVLFPEQMLINVAWRMIPNNTYGYNYDGNFREIMGLLGMLPDRAINYKYSFDENNIPMLELTQGTAGNKTVTIYYNTVLGSFPQIF